MLVKLGKYKNWFGCYQLADLLKHVGVSEDTAFNIGAKLADTKLQSFFVWVHKYQGKRKEVVRIDKWDTWSLDATLAKIAYPMLVQLYNNKHGAPETDINDVPPHMRQKDVFERWDWIMSEMVFAMKSYTFDWEDKYHTGDMDIVWVDCNDGTDCSEMTHGPAHTHVFDSEGWKKEHDRIQNGLRLFGTYFQGLWD